MNAAPWKGTGPDPVVEKWLAVEIHRADERKRSMWARGDRPAAEAAAQRSLTLKNVRAVLRRHAAGKGIVDMTLEIPCER